MKTSMIKTLLLKQPPPLPAVVPPGQWGNVYRKAVCTHDVHQEKKKETTGPISKRPLVLDAIRAGCTEILQIADRIEAHQSTVLVHVKALEKLGIVKISRGVIPFVVTLNRD